MFEYGPAACYQPYSRTRALISSWGLLFLSHWLLTHIAPMTKISRATVSECLAPFHEPLPTEALEQIRVYVELLDKWNRKISLTTVSEPRDVLRRHFGESMFAHREGNFVGGRLADVGTGAGFPGLALKIASPSLVVELMEPNKKKCAFLAEVVRELALGDVIV